MFIMKTRCIFINIYNMKTNISAMFDCNFMVTKSLTYKWNMFAICKHTNIIVFCQKWKIKAFTGGQMVRNQSCIYAKILWICIGKNLFHIWIFNIDKNSLIKNKYLLLYVHKLEPIIIENVFIKNRTCMQMSMQKKDYYLPRKEYNISAWHTRKFYVPKAHYNPFFLQIPIIPNLPLNIALPHPLPNLIKT